MKIRLIFITVACACFTLATLVDGQAPFRGSSSSSSLFDELRKNINSRKSSENVTTNSVSKTNQKIVVEDTQATPKIAQTNIVALSSNITTNVTQLPERVYVDIENDSELGFFPDSSTSSSQAAPSIPAVSTNKVVSESASLESAQKNYIEDVDPDGLPMGAATIEAIRKELYGLQSNQELNGSLSTNQVSTVVISNPSELEINNTVDLIVTSSSNENSSPKLDLTPSEPLTESEIQELLSEVDAMSKGEDIMITTAPLANPIKSEDYEFETSDYKIQPGDIIAIEVFQETDLSKEFKVASTGEITYPLLKHVKVAGKSAAQAERYIRALLERDYLVDPHVIIAVKKFKSQQISVQGYVQLPKLIELPPDQPLSILQAISEAGGIQRIGNPKRIELIREGEPNRTYKMDDLKKVNDPSKIIHLKPNDIVYVHERGLFQ